MGRACLGCGGWPWPGLPPWGAGAPAPSASGATPFSAPFCLFRRLSPPRDRCVVCLPLAVTPLSAGWSPFCSGRAGALVAAASGVAVALRVVGAGLAGRAVEPAAIGSVAEVAAAVVDEAGRGVSAAAAGEERVFGLAVFPRSQLWIAAAPGNRGVSPAQQEVPRMARQSGSHDGRGSAGSSSQYPATRTQRAGRPWGCRNCGALRAGLEPGRLGQARRHAGAAVAAGREPADASAY